MFKTFLLFLAKMTLWCEMAYCVIQDSFIYYKVLNLNCDFLLVQTSTTPGWPQRSCPTSWSSSGACPLASCPQIVPKAGKSSTRRRSLQERWKNTAATRTTQSGPSPRRKAPGSGYAWGTSTGTRQRRRGVVGRCARTTQWCGRPTGWHWWITTPVMTDVLGGKGEHMVRKVHHV